jgi:DEAD/DEAH box helicase domain-containing protein
MSLENLIARWKTDHNFTDCIQTWKVFPNKPGEFFPIPENLHPILLSTLHSAGIQALYSHQIETWKLVSEKQNVVIVTGTASGKTLCYNLPVLDRLLREINGRALYIFPTKALSQDQKITLSAMTTRINQFLEIENRSTPPNSEHRISLGPEIYDGDTPAHERPAIRSQSRLLLTNPDMLHLGILPHHTAWTDFFHHLLFVVIDEIHVYRGIFGSHVANVIRRLKRIANFYGSHPQFLLTSATIANPIENAQNLIEEHVVQVNHDGSPRGEKHFILYNPPIINQELGLRRGILSEATQIAADLIASGAQTIVFGRSRRTVEMLVKSLREETGMKHRWLTDTNQQPNIIRGYRSGYLPRKRREIESQLRLGTARAVVATNALELGIDIGDMNAAILVGYPGSIASTLQQAGRTGRKENISLAILIASSDPLDQFIARHPEFLFNQSPEHALINPDNLLILLDHIRCAIFELPFSAGDKYGEIEAGILLEFLQVLEAQGVIYSSNQKYFWLSDIYPSQTVSLRNIASDAITLKSESNEFTETIGMVDRYSAYWMVHQGAIYYHESETYLVKKLDLEANIAHLLPLEVDYYTEALKESSIELLNTISTQNVHSTSKYHSTIAFGEILVSTQVVGFKKIQMDTHEKIGEESLSLPPVQLSTKGCWLSLSEEFISNLRQNSLWINDVNDYGRDWLKIKALVRKRDEYRCQVCGIPETDRAHDVHHKIPFRSFSSAQEANQMHNLITLCRSCHQRSETNVKIHSGLAGLGYIFRHLAPFLLMCDSRDIGVHSDPKSSLANYSPSVIIYDQFPDGIGLSQKLFEIHPELIHNAYEAVSQCDCMDGCPSCVGPGGENGSGSKKETLAILQNLV